MAFGVSRMVSDDMSSRPGGFHHKGFQGFQGDPMLNQKKLREEPLRTAGRPLFETIILGIFTATVAGLPLVMTQVPAPDWVLDVKELVADWCTPSICFVFLIVGVMVATSGVLSGTQEENPQGKVALSDPYLVQRPVSATQLDPLRMPDIFFSAELARANAASAAAAAAAIPVQVAQSPPLTVPVYYPARVSPQASPVLRKPDVGDEGGRFKSLQDLNDKAGRFGSPREANDEGGRFKSLSVVNDKAGRFGSPRDVNDEGGRFKSLSEINEGGVFKSLRNVNEEGERFESLRDVMEEGKKFDSLRCEEGGRFQPLSNMDDKGGRFDLEGEGERRYDNEDKSRYESEVQTLSVESLHSLSVPIAYAQIVPDVTEVSPEVVQSPPPRRLSRSLSNKSSTSVMQEPVSPLPTLRVRHSARKPPTVPSPVAVREAPQPTLPVPSPVVPEAPQPAQVVSEAVGTSGPSAEAVAPVAVVHKREKVAHVEPKEPETKPLSPQLKSPPKSPVAPFAVSTLPNSPSPPRTPKQEVVVYNDARKINGERLHSAPVSRIATSALDRQFSVPSRKPREVRVADFDKVDDVDLKQDPPSDDDVDQRVEAFLRNFREQMRLQRQESMQRYRRGEEDL